MLSPILASYSASADLTLSQLKKAQIPVDLDLAPIQKYAEVQNISWVLSSDDHYPSKLKAFKSSPYLLYYQGNFSLLEQKVLGIVGPRVASSYAHQVMEHFFDQAKKYQIVTISGLAKGVDQLAHQLSLKYNLPTIAVLGGGFAHYLKSADRQLLNQILENGGLVISQFKIGFKPTKWSFPQRNQLLAQLADLLFLPEAKIKSWSLITAGYAHQFGKKIFSVPAPLFAPQSAGIFEKMQSYEIELLTDFSSRCGENFPYQNTHLESNKKNQSQTFGGYSQSQQKLLSLLQRSSPLSLERLLVESQIPYATLMQELTLLEMENLIAQPLPNTYQFIHK